MREYTATALARRFWAARPGVRDVLVLAIITAAVLWFFPALTLATALGVVVGTVLMAMAISAVAGPVADAGGLPAWRATRRSGLDEGQDDEDQVVTDTDTDDQDPSHSVDPTSVDHTGPSSSGGAPDAS